MGIFVEAGSFERPKPIEDEGTFTVQTTDVPLSMRRKGKASWRKPQKHVRLTPIKESEEHESDVLFTSRYSTRTSPVSSSSNSAIVDVAFDVGPRPGTLAPLAGQRDPDTRLKKVAPLVLDFLDEAEEELENILEFSDSSAIKSDDSGNKKTLPPRPRCKLKVLPPSLTERGDSVSPRKKKKLSNLRRRCKSVNNIYSMCNSPASPSAKQQTSPPTPAHESVITDLLDRPCTAGDNVRVIQLSDLKSLNGNSVPDLPSIVSKLTQLNEIHKTPDVSFDDSGALSTPRRTTEEPLGPVEWGVKSLRGTEMSSFYNMWERDSRRRPFEKREGQNKLKELKVKRSCMCSLKACMKQCRTLKLKPLPPIRT